jgi:flagellar assembly factor FliW
VVIDTRYFGKIEVDESKVLHFPHGLPGFPDDKRFLLMPEEDPPGLFYWLQSIDDGNVAFTLMDVYDVVADYNPLVDMDEAAELGDLSDMPLEILNIVIIPEDTAKMRVNLKAPIVINMHTGLGMQVIVNNDEYPIRYMIFDEMKKYSEIGKDR